MGNRRDYLVKSIVEICRKLDTRSWVANHDGNVTVRLEDMLLATPTATSKADVVPELILTLDMEGKKLEGIGKPFSEINLHLAAYRTREDITAVVHAHPPFAMARGLLGKDFEISVPEAVVSIGDVIPAAPYALPGAPEHDRIVAEMLGRCDVFMMAGNGVLSVGRDVKEAYLRMELLEHLVKIDTYAGTMESGREGLMTLPPGDRQKLLEKRASIGLGPRKANLPSADQSPSPTGAENQPTPPQSDIIKDLVAREIKKIFQEK